MAGSIRKGPLVGCGAAIVDGSRILLVKRRRQPEAGHWGLPGGKVDWLERVEHAVIREIREELGVELALNGSSASWTNWMRTLMNTGSRRFTSRRSGTVVPPSANRTRWPRSGGSNSIVCRPQ